MPVKKDEQQDSTIELIVKVELLHDNADEAIVRVLDTGEVYVYNKAQPVSYHPFTVRYADLTKRLEGFGKTLRQIAVPLAQAEAALYRQGLRGGESADEVVAALMRKRITVVLDKGE